MSSQPPSDQTAWDAFIDELDRAGQAGTIEQVALPPITGALAGKRFGELTSADVKDLARVGGSLGRRGETLSVMWKDLQWKVKRQKKAAKARADQR
jgi:hypothetical protein